MSKFMKEFFVSKIMEKAEEVRLNCYINDHINHKKLSIVLNEIYLRRLIYCKPKNFNVMCIDLFDKLPIIADYYHPSYIFKNALIDDSILSLRGKKAADAFDTSRINLMVELKRIEVTYYSYRSLCLYKRVADPNLTLNIFKNILRKVIRLQSVSIRLSDEESLTYPSWVRMFAQIFNYDELSNRYGYEIVKASGLEVCPYCNAEEIRTIQGAKSHRPDIDHFLPKAKYPFFAASIYNFVPAGGACNRSFKRDVDLMQGYIHPLVEGVERSQLFKFDYNDVIRKLVVDINEIPRFGLNASLFQLSEVYKHNFYCKRYSSIRRQYEKLLEICADGDISKKKDLMETFFHVSESPRLKVNKKFEEEALQHIKQKLEPLTHRPA
ncbi:hypothetical protein [Erwinia persicina]|uniref:hypothetical protein n=1 Tax=Erwinia persicina TaxID=55211 RepID=UPI0013C2FD52|nr:hypothetical protein [Erwinia persicina]